MARPAKIENTRTEAPDLPKGGEDLARSVADHCIREESKNQWRWLRYLLATVYLDNYRSFGNVDPLSPRLEFNVTYKNGKMPVQLGDLLSHVNRVAGAMGAVDRLPSVIQEADTLQTIRDRSIAQILLNAVVSPAEVRATSQLFDEHLVTLGCCAMATSVVDDPVLGLTAQLEVVHPREIFPFPSLAWDSTKARGIVRQRLVPLSFLESRILKRKMTDEEWDKCEGVIKNIGEEPREQSSDLPGPYGGGANVPKAFTSVPAPNTYRAVKIREVWLDGPRGTCIRYVCTSGRAVFVNEFYDDAPVYKPIHKATFFGNLSWYGAGLYDMLFSAIRENEKLVEDLIQNVREMDIFPVTVLPHGVLNERQVFKDDGRKGMKIVTAQKEPSYMGGDDIRPTVIPHTNAGEVAGRVSSFIRQIIDSQVPVQDILRNKGRVDSASGLQFLDEQSSQATNSAVRSVVSCWGGIYQYIGARAAQMAVMSAKSIPLSSVTIDMAGAVIDWEKGTLSFQGGVNPFPDVTRLTFTVKSASTRSRALRKQEALELYDRKLMTREDFILLNLKEGLDFAIEDSQYRAAYETVVRNLLSIYGDGMTPGEAWVTRNTEMPAFQLKQVNAFLASIAVRRASPAVVNELQKYRETLEGFLGQVLPEGLPDPYGNPLMGSGGGGTLLGQGSRLSLAAS
jgi:hypothetical protein